MSVSKLCEELVLAGHVVSVATTTANGVFELPVTGKAAVVVDGVEIRYFRRLTKDHSHFSPSLCWHLWKNARNYDLLHVHAWWNLVSIFSCIIGLIKGVPVLLTPRGTLSTYTFFNRTSTPKRIFHRLIGSPILKRCYFHVTSEKEKTDILKLLKTNRIKVIPNFVRLGEPALDGPLESEAVASLKANPAPILKLLFLSRVEEKKGLELLFSALAVAKIKWQLSIAGTGKKSYLESLQIMAEKNGISGQVAWLGHVANDSKFDLMRQHDLLVLPSFDENFANVVIESLSVGTAVLISEQVGLADYVRQNKLGWVCKRTRNDILKTLIEIADNGDELMRIRKNSVGFIWTDFNEKAILDAYVDLYKSISTDKIPTRLPT